MIFKDLVNQNEANTHPKPIPKKNEAGEGLLALFFKDSYGFGPPSFAPECYPNPFKKVSRKKQHTGCILWEPSPLHARACTGHGVRRVPHLYTSFLRKTALAKALAKTKHHCQGQRAQGAWARTPIHAVAQARWRIHTEHLVSS